MKTRKAGLRQLVYKIYRVFWKIIRPTTLGARALLIRNDEIILVKHTYQKHWYLPGGGVKKGETYDEALERELKEELGAEVKKLELFGLYNNFYEGKNDSVAIFHTDEYSITKKPCGEIAEIGTFRIDHLPPDISPGSRKRILEYIAKENPCFGSW